MTSPDQNDRACPMKSGPAYFPEIRGGENRHEALFSISNVITFLLITFILMLHRLIACG
jgi:hypothetical protein